MTLEKSHERKRKRSFKGFRMVLVYTFLHFVSTFAFKKRDTVTNESVRTVVGTLSIPSESF